MDSLIQDLRFALRTLRQRPLFVLVAVLSLALGIGATTTVFSAVNSLVLRAPPGVNDPDRVVEIGRTMGGRGMDSFSYPELRDMQQGARGLDVIAGWRFAQLSFSTGGEGERIQGMLVSHGYFDVLGLRPARGRFFSADEDATPGTHPVAVVSHRFWQERLSGDPDVVGRTIDLNRRPFTVVGVAPAGFDGHIPALNTKVFVPMMMAGVVLPGFDAFEERRANWFTALGRLSPGATIGQANASLAALFNRLKETDPARYEQRSARAVALGPVPGGGRGQVTAFLGMLLGLSGMILLITCANVGGMLLARAASREREIAVRLALGSGRARLIRQLVTESLVLFVAGGAAGVLLAIWGADVLSSAALPVPVDLALDLRPDAFVLTFGLVLALVTGMLFGLAPAFQSTRPALTAALKNESARSASRGGRLRRVFVRAQIGLSLVLLLTAGLFLRSLQRAAQIDTGFDPAGVRMLSLDLAIDGYDEDRGRVFVSSLVERLRAIPGVTHASAALDLPMDFSANETPAYPEGYVPPGEFPGLPSAFNVVTDQYFETLNVRIEEGRPFQATDRAGSERVAVVSRTFAERAWPGQEAVGKRLRFGSAQGEPITVVGVAADVKNQVITEEAEPMAYFPFDQLYRTDVNLLVKSNGAAVSPQAIIQAVRSLDANISLRPVQSVEEYTGVGLMPQRIAAATAAVLGTLALLLSAIGVYGVIAYMVAQQRREVGVRIALGARRTDVIRLVMTRGLRLAVPGLVFGLAAGVALARVIRSFTLGVAPGDPATFLGGPLVLLAVIALATLLPARRASSVDPIVALKSE